MAYFPMFVDLKGKKIIVIGGGKVAYRKVTKLLPFEAEITVIAPDICFEIQELLNDNSNLILKNRNFETEDIKNAFLVISATNNNSTNQQVAQICKSQNIPINSVDDIENCTFLFPALIKKESLVIGCSTSGKVPDIAAFIKNAIEQDLPQNIGQVVEILGILREELKHKVPTQKIRAKIIHNLLEYCQAKDFKISYNELQEKMQNLIIEFNESQLIK